MIYSGCAVMNSEQKLNDREEGSHVKTRKDIGKEVLIVLRNQLVFITEPEVVSMVNRVGRDVVRAAGGDPDYYHFFVVREKQVNAFAVPGGYIFINDELIKNLESIDALAGLLAHEVAHIERDHLFKDAKKTGAADLATFATLILAGLSGSGEVATAVVAQAANISYKLKMSREHEEDADLFAIRYLRQSGYDPRGLSDLFKAINYYARHNSADLTLPYLSTHPGVMERQLTVEALVKDLPLGSSRQNDYLQWERIVTILKAESKEAMFVNTGSLENSEESMSGAHYLRGLYALKSLDFRKALPEYLEAIRLEPMNPLYHADLASLYLNQHQTELAKKEALKSIEISNENALPYFVLGMISKDEGAHELAIDFFKKSERLSAYNPLLHYQMAESYHALNMSAAKRLHLGRYYRYKLDRKNALVQFRLGLKESVEEADIKRFKDELASITSEGV